MAAVKVLQARDDRPGSRLMAPLPPRYDNERRELRAPPTRRRKILLMSFDSRFNHWPTFVFKKKNKKKEFFFLFKIKIDFDWTSS